jgi:uncharacterized protein YukE
MTEAEIHANPQRIQALADELRMFVNKLRSELEKMKSEIHHLGSTWRDVEYEKFKRSFDRLQEDIGKIDQEIIRREPELEADAQSLLAYLNKATD